ncbi:NUDIX domain-containing protein [Xenorhabdus sp. Flor]|uniref:NUDIX domain-containing protein n=1 Tax=Xenorhabdus cabanillasii TaxID=351673 RepID=UPI0019C439BB|nr:NUDIX domain-containing protein [Xenorhabdus sp. Flor]MBD2815855.1 NUDIX domain-containing protein [Xenorhabdus sp. Flor]
MIRKCAAIIINNKKLLVVKKHKTSMYISPGGKIEKNETQIECLIREIQEEIGVTFTNPTHFSIDYAKSAFEGESMEINSWLIDIIGEPFPCSEIIDLKWITSKEAEKIQIGSVFKDSIIPKLKNIGLIE